MKTNLFILILTCYFFSIPVLAQIKVKSTGKVKVGLEVPATITDDPYNVLTMQLYGNYSDLRCGSKLAFGDFGRYDYYGWTAFIGEYGNYDSDRLWLHGKNGIYLTWNRGDNIIGYYDVSVGNRFNFNCDVYSNGVKLSSDARFKTNVSTITNSLASLCKLNGVSYNFLHRTVSMSNKSLKELIDSGFVAPSEKEQKDKVYFEALEEQMDQTAPKGLGFIAQDLQKVFPELVDKDSSGYLYIDYIGLIPVLVEALKEQQNTIDEQKNTNNEQSKQIKALEKRIADIEKIIKKPATKNAQVDNSDVVNDNELTTKPELFTNNPNPFNQSTQIGYYIPENTNNAVLYIYDMNGTQVKKVPINQNGKGSITISGSELHAGMYLYTLIVDGQEIDTKRMILTQ